MYVQKLNSKLMLKIIKVQILVPPLIFELVGVAATYNYVFEPFAHRLKT